MRAVMVGRGRHVMRQETISTTNAARVRSKNIALKLIVVWGAIASLGWMARLPRLSHAESAVMARRFQFERSAFPHLHPSNRSLRKVNPAFQNIAGWISSVGAAIALGDLDGDGLPNDACLVDPRTDDVIITPVPGTGDRYRPFALNPAPLPYDAPSSAPMGCLLVDLNEDGLLDIVVYYWGRSPVLFLRRQPAALAALSPASFIPQELVSGNERWYTNAGLAADLDGDGHADLIFGNYFPDGAAVLQEGGPGEMQSSMSRAANGGSKPVFLWKAAASGENPQAIFVRDRTMDSQFGTGWTLALAACDLDGDLLPEIYIANDFGPDRLLHNLSTPGHLQFQTLRGRRDWSTPKSKVLGQDSYKGMGVDCADLNGDGLPDIMVSNITDEYALEESNLVFVSTGETGAMRRGVAPYRERGESLGLARSGWSWDVRFGDFDNDSFPEIVQATGFLKGTTNRWPQLQELAMGNDLALKHLTHWPRLAAGDDLSGGNHDRFFVRSAQGRYFDLGPEVGLDEPLVTRGVATADVDGDGRLDFALADQWADSYFFHNVGRPAGAFIALHVLLPIGSASTTLHDGYRLERMRGYAALGARVTVFLPDGRKLVQQVDGGNGHSGKRSPDLHFGLGTLDQQALPVAFDWRDRSGRVHHWETTLAPGWHTVLLGNDN